MRQRWWLSLHRQNYHQSPLPGVQGENYGPEGVGNPAPPETRAVLVAPEEVGDPGFTIVVSVSTTTVPPELEEVAISVVTEAAADAVEGVGTACVNVVATVGSADEELEPVRYQAPHISSRMKRARSQTPKAAQCREKTENQGEESERTA